MSLSPTAPASDSIVRTNLRMMFHLLVTQAKEENQRRCCEEFARLANSEGTVKKLRISCMFQDGGAFHKDFEEWEEAARCFSGNVRYGSPLLIVAFEWTEKLGWTEFARYPQH